MKENKKSVYLLILSVLLAIISGIVGGMASWVYFSDNFFNMPFSNEINFSGTSNGSGIIIRNPKKVVVEQNDKIVDTSNSVKNSLMGIYKKISTGTPPSIKNNYLVNLDNFYKLDEEAGQGLIITSDGWVVSGSKVDKDNYILISQDRKIYKIDKIINDSVSQFSFIHISAQDLPVRRFAERYEIKNGQLAAAINMRGEIQLNTIVNAKNFSGKEILSSDIFTDNIILADKIDKKFENSFLFDINGDIIGLIKNDGTVESISHFKSAVISLLKNKEIQRPSLGINYLDFAKYISSSASESEKTDFKIEKGALVQKDLSGMAVIKGSAADRAGFKEGDIIISIDGIEINKDNTLTDIIQDLAAGDNVNIIYYSQGKELNKDIVLGVLK